MTTVEIFYDGLGLSGKRTTLAALAAHLGSIAHHQHHRIPQLTVSRADLRIAISRSTYRASRIYDVNAVRNDSTFVSEFDALQRAVGLVFVVDPQLERLTQQIRYLEQLRTDLCFLGRDLRAIPVVFQINKSDLSSGLELTTLRNELSWPDASYVQACATRGAGVLEVLNSLLQKLGIATLDGAERGHIED